MMDHPQTNQILSKLTGNPQIRARKLKVQSSEGKLVIQGTVESFFAKQMAQESLREIDGICEIENHLQVCWS